jgi:GNAT superfamily N-acetyltransferase
MPEELMIRPLAPEDAAGCDAVFACLPQFFGDPTGIADCARAVRSQPGIVAHVAGNVAGFLTLQYHFPESAELTWMAVHADHRRVGIGGAMMKDAVALAGARGARMLCVLTLGPSVAEAPGDNYEGTRRFYRTQGFVPLRELGLREWSDSHALILARPI